MADVDIMKQAIANAMRNMQAARMQQHSGSSGGPARGGTFRPMQTIPADIPRRVPSLVSQQPAQLSQLVLQRPPRRALAVDRSDIAGIARLADNAGGKQ